MTSAPATSHRKLHPTVIVLGLVSFLNDFASDIVIPLLPILLTTVLGAGPAALGVIEGVAEAVASFLKLWSGRRSDALGGRRKPLTVAGYLLSNIARPMLAFAGNWLQVLLLRGVDRVGKGLRSAPRDALVGDVTNEANAGLAFGFHRALDNAGAVAGSLCAAWVIAVFATDLSNVMLWSAIPGAIGVLLMIVAVREPATHRGEPPALPPLSWRALSPRLRRYLVVLGVFTLARVSETFLVLRGHELGQSLPSLLVMWASLNLVKALTAYGGGMLSDRYGRAAVMLASWIAFAFACFLFCRADTYAALWGVVLFYGAFAGLSEGAERALLNALASPNERGGAFGWYYLMVGVAAIPGGLWFGFLWQWQSAAIAFSWAGALAAAAALMLQFWVPPVSAAPEESNRWRSAR